MMRIDLNADMGEGFGPWSMGDDKALLDVISSANIACAFHAGDPDHMAAVMRAAVTQGVGIGAHPGFADMQGFGRRRMSLSSEELGNLVAYQLGAAQAMARRAGGQVRHLKLHGALSNMAAEDASIARACFEAALAVDPELILVVMPLTAMDEAAEALGAKRAGEIFADRAYTETGLLAPRGTPGAMIHDASEAAERVAAMLRAGGIVTGSGKVLPCRIDTVCVHGDSPDAVAMARALRGHLAAEGIGIARFG
nr:5-oxoprolinase subunit PxpA [Thioclava marina]